MRTKIYQEDDFEVFAIVAPMADAEDLHVTISTSIATDGYGEYRPAHKIRVHLARIDEFIRTLRAAEAETRAQVALREEAY